MNASEVSKPIKDFLNFLRQVGTGRRIEYEIDEEEWELYPIMPEWCKELECIP